jgi:3D (Asp-Asp-Asp) domain-containing protein
VSGWSSAAYLAPLAPGEAIPSDDPAAPSIVLGRVYSVLVTAYTYQVPGNGAHGWITRSGDPAVPGVVAVDPRLIPLGSTVAIDGYDQLFVAKDTGFGVLGHHIDVFFPDLGAAVAFGVQRRDVIVYE